MKNILKFICMSIVAVAIVIGGLLILADLRQPDAPVCKRVMT